MSKKRVYELAKELEKSSKEIQMIAEKLNIDVKGHMSMLSEEDISKIKGVYERRKKRLQERKQEHPARKKRNVVQVFNLDNSRISGGPDSRLVERKARKAEEEKKAEEKRLAEKKAAEEAAKAAEKARIQAELAAETASADKALEAMKKAEAEKKKEEKAEAQAKVKAEPKAAEPAKAPADEPGKTMRKAETSGDGRRQERKNSQPRREDSQRGGSSRDNRGQNRRGERPQGGNNRPGSRNDRDQNRSSGGGYGSRSQNGRGERPQGGNNRPGNRGDRDQNRSSGGGYGSRSQNGRGERLQGGNNRPGGSRMTLEQPSEAMERQNQKNERQNQRNDKKRYEKDRFEKQRTPKSLEKPARKPVKPQPKQEPKTDEIRNIVLPEVMTIKELADKMKVQPSVIVKKLFLQGTIVTVNEEIDFEKAEEIALEFNCIAEAEEKVDVIAELLKEDEEAAEVMIPRSPVVCVMGHVDHGKTSLLDAIRNTRVTDREAGGITQHIGAYVVPCNGQEITFLDTPGHEAFTAMRMRGANATDIAILVVAADDGVMPQTVEAINHAKAAGVEIIVAINKIDKPSANVDKVKQELAEYELVPEDWGGSTVMVPVSAHTQEGIDQLLEMILLTAEILELKANPDRQARGLVIEAELDKGKGPVATVLVQKGTLHVGDFVAAGPCFGKVRAMMDDTGRRVQEAGPSKPVEILGFNDVPGAGEIFVAPESDKEARSFAQTFVSEGRQRLLEETKKAKMSLDDLFSQIQAGNLKELDIIVKADVQGSVEAVRSSLLKLSNDEVVVKVIHGGVGAITESDVSLASASNAIIIGFNVRPDATAKVIAEREGVDVRLYKVIYNAIEDVQAAMKGMLDPIFEEQVLGHAEIRQIFKASGVGTIAGSYVTDGIFKRGCSVRVRREEELIHEGALASLKRFKDDVREVRSNYECGLVLEDFNDLQEGDIIEAYEMVEVPR